jgi:hypothetical protein
VKKSLVVLLGLAVILSSCVIPEKYTLDITVDKQSTYSVTFKGTLLFLMALAEKEESGEISADTDNQIKNMFDDWVAAEPAISNYEYRQDGRAYLEYTTSVSDGSRLDLTNSFQMPLIISTDENGNVIIEETAVEDTDGMFEAFSNLGYSMDGTIRITSELPIIDASGLKVSRSILGLFGNYVINQKITSFPSEDIIITIGKQ